MAKKPITLIQQFADLDIRVGLVLKAEIVEKSNKLFLLTVDLGEDYGIVEIFTGLRKWYTPEDFIGKKFLFIANLAPRPMMGKFSNGMLIAINQGEQPIIFPLPQEVEIGSTAA